MQATLLAAALVASYSYYTNWVMLHQESTAKRRAFATDVSDVQFR